MPTPEEAGRESHDGHAMLCVGYSDKDERRSAKSQNLSFC
jgi:C1A family cysteine protease